MTNKEAKTIMEKLLLFYRPLGGSVEAWDMAIKALEKADKYRWHDLRKNPNDLPEDNGYGESDYVLVLAGCFEWNHCEWACYSHSAKKWSTYVQEVFAWRYIEPFEEEEEE